MKKLKYNKTLPFVIKHYKGDTMVQAVINIQEHQDRVLNIVKGKFGLKNKSDAVNFIIGKFEEEMLEPELRPEYKTKLTKIMKGKHLSREEMEKEVG
tara:strand:- start:2096 stop:2386 length:291 start_codon:yes stop_codon:yes gene_type:complete